MPIALSSSSSLISLDDEGQTPPRLEGTPEEAAAQVSCRRRLQWFMVLTFMGRQSSKRQKTGKLPRREQESGSRMLRQQQVR
eukprot:317673-Rhodomonas_salina.1